MSAFARLGILSIREPELRPAKQPIKSIFWPSYFRWASGSNDNGARSVENDGADREEPTPPIQERR